MLKKYSWISWIAITAAGGLAYANEPAQVSTPQTEVSVTRARVQQLTRELNEREAQVDPATVSSDFVTARADFMHKIRSVMPQFEQKIGQILSRFQPMMNRIRSIEQSTGYDDAQKRSLIGLIESEIAIVSQQTKAEYQDAIAQVYVAAGDIPLSVSCRAGIINRVKFAFIYRDHTILERFRGSNLIGYNSANTICGISDASREPWRVSSYVLRETGILAQVKEVVTQGCQTRACMSLMIEEWNSYVDMVSSHIDLPLPVGHGHQEISALHANQQLIHAAITLSNTWQDDLTIPFSN